MASTRELLLIFPRLRYPSGDVPTGILYLASSVRKQLGITPDILDLSFSKKPMDDVRRTLVENTYRWVGLSAMVTMAAAAREVASLVKEMQPQARIILGGPHPTTLPDKCLDGPFDFTLQWTAADESREATEVDRSAILTALNEQLGLKLEQRKCPVDLLVIDRLEKVPTEN